MAAGPSARSRHGIPPPPNHHHHHPPPLLHLPPAACCRLRTELKIETQLEEEAWDAVKKGILHASVAESISTFTTKNKAQVMWKQQWTKGTKYSRRLIMCGCGCACGLVAMAVAIAASAVYYSTNCMSLSKYSETRVYSDANFGPFVYIQSNYSLGVTKVVVDTGKADANITVSETKGAFKQSMASAAWPDMFALPHTTADAKEAPPLPAGHLESVTYTDPATGTVYTNTTARGIRPVSGGPTNVLGYDVSCQSCSVTVTLPRTDVLTGGAAANDRAAGDAFPVALRLEAYDASSGVNVDLSSIDYVDRPRIRSLVAATTAGALEVGGALVGSAGLQATTTLGAIDIHKTEVRCDPTLLGTGRGGVRLATTKGTLTVDGLDARDCDVSLTVGAALSTVINSRITNSLGGGTLQMVGAVGVMQVVATYADVIDVKGDQGSVQVNNVTIAEALKVATTLGTVSMQTVRAASRAVIQVETDTGDIEIWATQFRGLVSIVTGGNINCISGAASGFNDASPCAVTAGGTVQSDSSSGGGGGGRTLRFLDNIAVNCRTATRDDCPYLGHITITSNSGNVVLRMDRYSGA